MAKGQQRSNREPKKPKKTVTPAEKSSSGSVFAQAAKPPAKPSWKK